MSDIPFPPFPPFPDPSVAPAEVDPAEARISLIEQRIAMLTVRHDINDSDIAALKSVDGSLRSTLDTLASTVVAARDIDSGSRHDAIALRVIVLESQAAQARAASDALTTALAAAEEREQAANARIDTLTTALDASGQSLTAIRQTVAGQVAGMNAIVERVAAAEAIIDPPNRPPEATISTVVAGSTVTVTVTSSDLDGDNLSVLYNYSDELGWVSSPIHTFPSPGVYRVGAKVSDGETHVVAAATIEILPTAITTEGSVAASATSSSSIGAVVVALNPLAGSWNTTRVQAVSTSVVPHRPGAADVVAINTTGLASSTSVFWNGGTFTATRFTAVQGTVMELSGVTATSFTAKYRHSSGVISGVINFTKRP